MNLDGRYLVWLYSKVEADLTAGYWELLKVLYHIRFFWTVRLDDNRAEEGRDLRFEFILSENIKNVPVDWRDEDCSFLEMLIALSRRMSEQGGTDIHECFLEIIQNLGFSGYTDETYIDYEHISEHLEDVMCRSYDENGVGGMFPLDEAGRDQRGVELLYQMYAYLLERRSMWTSST